jgi:predicted DNA-binding transcriptional regulator YafY
MKENLNIAWWHERMILMALAKYTTQRAAAKALGVSERTLIRMKHDLYEDKLRASENGRGSGDHRKDS